MKNTIIRKRNFVYAYICMKLNIDQQENMRMPTACPLCLWDVEYPRDRLWFHCWPDSCSFGHCSTGGEGDSPGPCFKQSALLGKTRMSSQPDEYQSFCNRRWWELSTEGQCLLWGNRLIIPLKLRVCVGATQRSSWYDTYEGHGS